MFKLRRCVAITKHIRKLSQVISVREDHRMRVAKVRSVAGEPRLQIYFTYGGAPGKERMYNFDRLQSEELEKTISRIGIKVTEIVNKKLMKKRKKMKLSDDADGDAEEVTEAKVNVLHGGQVIPESTTNVEAWTEGATLDISGTEFEVQVNLPTAVSVKLPRVVMVNFPVIPKLELEFADIKSCHFKWYRSTETFGQYPDKAKVNLLKWEAAHEGLVCSPTIEENGRLLRLVCTPSDRARSGSEEEVVSTCLVSPGPDQCGFDKRHQLTTERAEGNSFRVVSYNILADLYADSDFSADFLYPYCPKEALHVDYRKLLVMRELAGYKADIVCLQEMDKKLFMSDYVMWGEAHDLHGLLQVKDGDIAEGTAVFYNTRRFSLVREEGVFLTRFLQTDPLCSDILNKLNSNPTFHEKMTSRNSALQLVVLSRNESPDHVLLVGNTHLYFHPRAPNVRALQTVLCVRYMTRLRQQLMEQGLRVTVMLCGDLNSALPSSGVHTFLRTGRVPDKHADWYSNGREQFIEGMTFTHDLDLYSTCGYNTCTNYVAGFEGCLDYIYTETEALRTLRVIPLPSMEELMRHTALPSPAFPSDHLAIVCDLTWTDTSEEMKTGD